MQKGEEKWLEIDVEQRKREKEEKQLQSREEKELISELTKKGYRGSQSGNCVKKSCKRRL